jgi:uncharacterized repeat protein (TIGR03803 family)
MCYDFLRFAPDFEEYMFYCGIADIRYSMACKSAARVKLESNSMKSSRVIGVFLGCACCAARGQLQLQTLHTTPSSNPATSLAQAMDGNFYGTFSNSVFKMTASGTVSTVGLVPETKPGLALANDGNLYGMSASGGLGYGMIFRVNPAGQIANAYSLSASDGKPLGLRAGVDGFLYGACLTSNMFGFSQVYSVFQFDTNGIRTALRLITNSLQAPTGDFSLPVQGADGILYGSFSGEQLAFPESGHTIFYRLSTNGSYQIISNVTTNDRSSSDLVFGSDGFLYGVMGSGRYPALGSVFRLSTNGGFTSLFQFGSTNGTSPGARLLPGADGALYGTTYSGGTSNNGTIFRITTNRVFTTVANFLGGTSSHPLAPLIQANDANIYGTTEGANVPSTGVIFRLVQAPLISDLSLSNGSVTLTWNSFTNGIYRVDYKSGVVDPGWTTLIPRVMATDMTTSAPDNSPAADQRFYRVVLLP